MMSTTGVQGVIKATISSPINVKANLSPQINIEADLSTPVNIKTEIDIPRVVGNRPYSGEYIVIPSDEEQVLETQGLAMNGNVIVKPIPENYGKITWNGSVLTVS